MVAALERAWGERHVVLAKRLLWERPLYRLEKEVDRTIRKLKSPRSASFDLARWKAGSRRAASMTATQ
jgi:hypothetical protein